MSDDATALDVHCRLFGHLFTRDTNRLELCRNGCRMSWKALDNPQMIKKWHAVLVNDTDSLIIEEMHGRSA